MIMEEKNLNSNGKFAPEISDVSPATFRDRMSDFQLDSNLLKLKLGNEIEAHCTFLGC